MLQWLSRSLPETLLAASANVEAWRFVRNSETYNPVPSTLKSHGALEEVVKGAPDTACPSEPCFLQS